MQTKPQERRRMRRFDMRPPASVRVQQIQSTEISPAPNRPQSPPQPTAEFHTETQNVSARGVYFYLDHTVPAGTHCEVTLTFPPHITLTDAVRVRFIARIVRSEAPLPSSRVGTAAIIEDYEFLRTAGAPDFLSAWQKNWKETN